MKTQKEKYEKKEWFKLGTKNETKAILNTWVLHCFLKVFTVCIDLKFNAKEFQS